MKEKLLAGANALNIIAGRAAGFTGWLLCAPLFYGVKITSNAQKWISSFSGPTVFTLAALNEIWKTSLMKRRKDHLKTDKAKINAVNDQIKNYLDHLKDESVKDSHETSYKLMLVSLNEELKTVIHHNQQYLDKEKFCMHLTTAIDVLINAAGGASAVLIYYVVGMLLFEDFNDPNIIYSGNILSALSAIFTSLLTIFNARSFWQDVEKDEVTIKNNLREFFTQLSILPDDNKMDSKIQEFLLLWGDKNKVKHEIKPIEDVKYQFSV